VVVARDLVKVEETAAAEEILREIYDLTNTTENSDVYAMALAGTAEGYAQVGKSQSATLLLETVIPLAGSVEQDEIRRLTLMGIASALVMLNKLNEAVEFGRKSENYLDRAVILFATASALIRCGNTADAIRIAQDIEEHDHRSEVLHEIASTYIEQEAHSSLLSLIRQSWLKASTKDELQSLLTLVGKLPALNSSIWVDIANSSLSVDEFLKQA
jgi:tetratricopeptide (TPR) repeat protein